MPGPDKKISGKKDQEVRALSRQTRPKEPSVPGHPRLAVTTLSCGVDWFGLELEFLGLISQKVDPQPLCTRALARCAGLWHGLQELCILHCFVENKACKPSLELSSNSCDRKCLLACTEGTERESESMQRQV